MGFQGRRAALILAAWLCVGLLGAATFDPIEGRLYIIENHDQYVLTITGIAPAVPGTRLKVLARFADDAIYNPPLVGYDGTGSTATVMFRPRWQDYGEALLTVTVAVDDGTAEGGAERFSRQKPITVISVNDPPFVVPPEPATLAEDVPARLRLIGLGAGPANEASQRLTIVATPLTDLVAVAAIEHVQGEQNAWITLAPRADAWGSTQVLVTIYDDGGTANGGVNLFSFLWQVAVEARPDPPVVARRRDLAVSPGNSAPITRDQLRLEDPDAPPAGELAFILAAAPPGELRRDGLALAPGQSFTQEEIDAGRLSYRHGGGGEELVSLRFTDGTLAEPLGPFDLHVLPAGLRRSEIVLGSATAAYGEGGPAAAVDARVDDDPATSYGAGWLSAEIAAGAAAGDRLDLAEEGDAPGQVRVQGGEVLVGGLAVGRVEVAADRRRLAVSFTAASATAATATAVLRALRFRSDSRDPGAQPRTLRLLAGNGLAGAGEPALVAVAVAPVDDPPVPRTARVTTLPGVAVDWPLAADDPDSAALAWSLVAPPARGRVEVLDGARLRIEPGPAGTFPLTLAVSDGASTVAAVVELAVADPDAPQPIAAGDPPHEAFIASALDVLLPVGGATPPLVALPTGPVPAGLALLPQADGVRLRWTPPAGWPAGEHLRFGVLVVDQSGGALHWPLSLLVHPAPGGVQ